MRASCRQCRPKGRLHAGAATDPLYVLYTSGTTGQPKGVVRDNGGHMAALQWSMDAIYGVKPGEVFWAASDIGWVVGHSYIVYAPLLHGNTTIVFEGKPVGTPDAGTFWRVISEHKVACCSPHPRRSGRSARKTRRQPSSAEYDLSASGRCSWLANGQIRTRSSGPKDMLKVPVIDHWWQTETGWTIAGNPMGLGLAAGQIRLAGRADAGLRRAGARRCRHPVAARNPGQYVVKLPLPPVLPADAVECRRPLSSMPICGVPRLLQDCGRRLHR
jgi:propionyl-CoA synthetase